MHFLLDAEFPWHSDLVPERVRNVILVDMHPLESCPAPRPITDRASGKFGSNMLNHYARSGGCFSRFLNFESFLEAFVGLFEGRVLIMRAGYYKTDDKDSHAITDLHVDALAQIQENLILLKGHHDTFLLRFFSLDVGTLSTKISRQTCS